MYIKKFLIFSLIFLFSQNAFAKSNLTIAIPLEPPHLDPTMTPANPTAEIVYGNIFQGLTKIDRNAMIKPCLAKKWDISDDGLTYTFHLHEGVFFHNETVFDADDVIKNVMLAALSTQGHVTKKFYSNVEDIIPVTPYIVRFKLKKPDSEFLFKLALPGAVIVAPENFGKHQTNPKGTGPYTLKNWSRGNKIELELFPGHWGEKPKIEKATYYFISDENAQTTSLSSGEVDYIPNYSAPEMVYRFKRDARFNIKVGTTEGETLLVMNHDHPPFRHLKVRQAVSHAIDRKQIIEGVYFGFAKPIGTHFSPNHEAYLDLTDRYPYDLKKAKQLLKEAGYANGFSATLKLPPTAYARRAGEIVAAQLQKIGINLEIHNVEWAFWLENVYRFKDYGMTIVAHTEPLDINRYARENYYFNYNSPDLRQVINTINLTLDQKKKNALYQEAQKIVTEDAVNVYLFQLPKIGIWKKGLQGIWVNSPLQAHPLKDLYWE